MKRCNTCGETKLEDEFATSHSRNKEGEVVVGRRSSCRICENKRRKQCYDKRPITRMFMNAKSRARSLGVEFNLEYEDVFIPTHCPILGTEFVLGEANYYEYSPSMDRMDPTKGYIKGNVKIISLRANRMKSNATKEELIAFSHNIIKYITDDIV